MRHQEKDEKAIDDVISPVIKLWQEGTNGTFNIQWRSPSPKISLNDQLKFWLVVVLAVWALYYAFGVQGILTTIEPSGI